MSFLQRIHDDGYGVIPRVLEAAQVDALIAAIEVMGPKDHGARNLLRRSGEIAALARSVELLRLVHPVLGGHAFPVRALFFDKVEGANWQVAWHQDLSIAVAERVEVPGFGGWSVKQGVVHVQPPVDVLERMFTLRIHLDDCDEENGPLRVLPGSHQHGRLSVGQIDGWAKKTQEVVCVVPRGGAVVMRPLLLHASAPATRPRHRRVIHLEYATGSLPAGLRWHEAASVG